MADKIRVTIKRQKVFHDGSSMVVLNPKSKTARVDARFVADLYKEGVIDDPGEAALRASAAATGFDDGGELKGPGDDSFSQPIGAFTEEQERSLAEQSQALGGDGDELFDDLLEENEQLRNALSSLTDRFAALETERDELQIQLNEAREQMAAFDPDGDGTPGGSTTAAGEDVPALRIQYKEVVGKPAFNGWDAAELRKRIADHQAGGAYGNQADSEDEAPAA